MPAPKTAIERLVDHNDGPTALSAKLGGYPVYQEIQRWVNRGWASPHHLRRLEPFLPPGLTWRDLDKDRERAKRKAGVASRAVA